MGQQQSFTREVHLSLCNNERAKLKALMGRPEFRAENLNTHIYAEVVQRQWGNEIVRGFVKVGNDDQLAILLAVVVLHTDVFPLNEVFDAMKDIPSAIAKHQLKPLFNVACDHGDLGAVKALIANNCYDASDDRPVVTVFRRAADKTAFDPELIKAVLSAHPGHKDAAKYIGESVIPGGKAAESKEELRALIGDYASSS